MCLCLQHFSRSESVLMNQWLNFKNIDVRLVKVSFRVCSTVKVGFTSIRILNLNLKNIISAEDQLEELQLIWLND